MTNASFANRGRSLEQLVEHANEQYQAKGLALIQKVATPWTVIRKENQIVSAFPAKKSTVDYIGVVRGRSPVAFDAKQCHDKARFPLSNIEQHQIDFLLNWQKQGGQSFLLIEMTAKYKICRLELDELMQFWNDALNGGRKSIPISEFDGFNTVCQSGGIVLDYLQVFSDYLY